MTSVSEDDILLRDGDYYIVISITDDLVILNSTDKELRNTYYNYRYPIHYVLNNFVKSNLRATEYIFEPEPIKKISVLD